MRADSFQMENTYGYLNIFGRNLFERELEKKGVMDNVPFLTRQEKMHLEPCG